MNSNPSPDHDILLAAIFDSEDKAVQAVEKLIDEDFPADQISLLHQSGGLGDDSLGVAFSSTGERMKVWGEQGAFWGALWGLLAGASGLFVAPGVGALLAAGPIVEALGGALTGAALTGGAMAGAAALTQLGQAMLDFGIPRAALQRLHQAIEDGKIVVLLHTDAAQQDRYLAQLRWAGAEKAESLAGS